jgi:hypothetical protein
MTERKPPGVSFESWVDRQIREAAERGEFENLPGAGKPLPGWGGVDDEDWWLSSYLRREEATGAALPTPLRLRKEVETLRETVARLTDEGKVREVVARLNEDITALWRAPSTLGVHVGPVSVDKVVAQWRADRAAAGAPDRAAPAAGDAPAARGGMPAGGGGAPAGGGAPGGRRGWWQRIRGRRARG